LFKTHQATSDTIAGNEFWDVAAGTKISLNPDHTGRRISFDVTTPFEVQGNSSRKTRYSAAWDKRKSKQNQIAKQNHGPKETEPRPRAGSNTAWT